MPGKAQCAVDCVVGRHPKTVWAGSGQRVVDEYPRKLAIIADYMMSSGHENFDAVTFDKGVPLLRFVQGRSSATIFKQWNFYMTNYAIERDLPLTTDEENANNQENQRKLFAAIRKAVPPSAQDIVSHIAPTAPLCGSLVWAALSDYYDANGAHDIGGMIDEFHA